MKDIHFKKALTDPNIKAVFQNPGADFILKDETFGFAIQLIKRKNGKNKKDLKIEL